MNKEEIKNTPQYYFAPMEGVTGYRFRNIHHGLFPGTDRYYSPFLSPSPDRLFNPKEERDIAPGNNAGIPLVPQVLVNRSDLMIEAVKYLLELNYPLINLNLGCPSGTVVSKRKGAGFLADPENLYTFFDETFTALGNFRLSVKTRLGLQTPAEFEEILKVYQAFPIEELIIHPRTRKEMYKGEIHEECFRFARQQLTKTAHRHTTPISLCMNGNLFCAEDVQCFEARSQEEGLYPISAYMFGRGFVANPALVRELQTGQTFTLPEFIQFHDLMYADVKEYMSGDRNILFRMKEYWYYWATMFSHGDKCVKLIRKCQRCADYEAAVRTILGTYEFTPEMVHF